MSTTFMNALNTETETDLIIVKFRNGREVTYTAAIRDLLATSGEVAWIIDAETGELLYY